MCEKTFFVSVLTCLPQTVGRIANLSSSQALHKGASSCNACCGVQAVRSVRADDSRAQVLGMLTGTPDALPADASGRIHRESVAHSCPPCSDP